MARGATLISILTKLRAKTRYSQNPAHNNQTHDAQVKLIQSIQEWLWDDFTWPFLRVERTIDLQNGQRYYDTPEDLDLDRIERIEVRDNGRWKLLENYIEPEHYYAYDSDLDVRSSPVRRWQVYEGEQIEIWPIPAVDADATTLEGKLRITGIRKLNPLVADDDRADLDDELITLYAASEILAASGAKDAELKLTQANKRYARLRGAQTQRTKFKMFGDCESKPILRGPPSIYYRVVS